MQAVSRSFLLALLALTMCVHAEERGTEWKDAGKNKDVLAILELLPEGSVHRHAMVPMRDEVKLATEIFLPSGDGPWPVVLMRTPYGRFNGARYASRLKNHSVAFAIQDPRGDGGSEGKGTVDPVNSENEIQDGYDCVEWIVKQPWCNGRVGMFGGSGHGLCACMAYLSKAPNLVVCNPGNSSGNTAIDWAFENGVRKWLYQWLSNRGQDVEEWPKPTLMAYDARSWHEKLPSMAEGNDTVLIMGDGWYNIFGDAMVWWFKALAPKGKVFFTMGPGTHGGAAGLSFKSVTRGSRPGEAIPSFFEILEGKEVTARSALKYYMLGDIHDSNAPGCSWKVTCEWPVDHTPRAIFLTTGGGLTFAPPGAGDGRCIYRYDPREPCPTVGGHHFYDKCPSGALDQRPLTNRTDVLRFVSEPLEKPVAMTGHVLADLFVSIDVPDTALILKLIDVYPDGYEALIRETAFMARYRDGLDSPAPVEPGTTYRMQLSMGATSIAFNTGHRIGLLITSSSTPAYEVHPNTYEPVMTFEESPVATIAVHASKPYPSRIVLPIVEP